jgi:hypothetical protein
MDLNRIEQKITNGSELSTNELAQLIVIKHEETREDINLLARITMSQFEKVYTCINTLESGLNNRIDSIEKSLNNKIDSVEQNLNTRIDTLEINLNKKLDFNNEKTSHRIDWVESKIQKLA